MIYHIKELINPYYQECIKSDLNQFETRWIKSEKTVLDSIVTDVNVRDNGQQVISLKDETDVPHQENCMFFFMKPLILSVANQMGVYIKSIRRVKFNKLSQDTQFTGYNIPHQDHYLDNYYSFVYYVNNSDGDTVFFDGDKIIARFAPKQGEIIFFKSTIVHASCNPKHNKERIVLNVVLEV
jgi:hypothetical protein